MNRVLVIDQDPAAMQRLGLACLERGVGVRMADNVCEGVRVLVDEDVSLIVVDASLLRLTPWEHAAVFERVAPGVPVSVAVGGDMSLESRAGFELAGFRVVPRPVGVEDVADKLLAP
jgi:DNA-binding response OmpR family regulator